MTRKRTLLGGGALERGHSASLEPLAQLGDALRGVGAFAIRVDAAELVVGQTAMRRMLSMGADAKPILSLGARRGAHLSSLSTPFSLMQLAMKEAEVTPSPLLEKSSDSTGSVPLSCLTGIAKPSRLSSVNEP